MYNISKTRKRSNAQFTLNNTIVYSHDYLYLVHNSPLTIGPGEPIPNLTQLAKGFALTRAESV